MFYSRWLIVPAASEGKVVDAGGPQGAWTPHTPATTIFLFAWIPRRSAAGNAVQYICFERQVHGFITMGRAIDEAHTAVDLCAAALRRALFG